MWRELVLAMDTDAEFHSPASDAQLAQVEVALGVTLPAHLSSLLRESDGVEVSFGTRLIWSTTAMIENNVQMRSESRSGGDMGRFMPIDYLLFFSEASNGDLYAFPITPEGVGPQIFMWDHEDDSRTCEADSLLDWFTQHPQSSTVG